MLSREGGGRLQYDWCQQDTPAPLSASLLPSISSSPRSNCCHNTSILFHCKIYRDLYGRDMLRFGSFFKSSLNKTLLYRFIKDIATKLHFWKDPIYLKVGRCFIDDSFIVVGIFLQALISPIQWMPSPHGRVELRRKCHSADLCFPFLPSDTPSFCC